MNKEKKDNYKLKKKKLLDNQKLLSIKQKEEIKKAFDSFDITGVGFIEHIHIKVVLRALGFDPSEEEIYALIKNVKNNDLDIEDNKKNIIDFQEFLEIMIIKISEKDTVEDIKKAFYLFMEPNENEEVDENNPGYISKSSLKKVIEYLGEDMTEEEIEELIVRAKNKNQLITMGEISNEDKEEDVKNYDDNKNKVTMKQFIKLLTDDIGNDIKVNE